MTRGVADRGEAAIERFDGLASGREPLARPGERIGNRAASLGRGRERDGARHRLEGRYRERAGGIVKRAGVSVEPGAHALELVRVRRGCAGGRLGGERAANLGEYGALARLSAVELESEVAEPDRFEPPLDDLERGGLFGDEEHGAALAETLGDDVGDGLRLARARGPFDDATRAALGSQDGRLLARVGVENLKGIHGVNDVVEDGRVRNAVPDGSGVVNTREQPHERVGRERAALGPGRRVEIAVDQQLREAEEAEVNLGQDSPTQRRDRRGDGGEIGVEVEALLGRVERRQLDAKLPLAQLGERRVRHDVVLEDLHRVAAADAAAGELDGNEDERRARDPLRAGVVPLDDPERDVEDIASLLFDRARRLARQVQEARLKTLAFERGLERPVVVARLPHVVIDGRERKRGLIDERIELGIERAGDLLGRLLAGEKAEAPSLADKETIDLGWRLVDDSQRAPSSRATVEQPVAPRQIEQPAADVFESLLNHGPLVARAAAYHTIPALPYKTLTAAVRRSSRRYVSSRGLVNRLTFELQVGAHRGADRRSNRADDGRVESGVVAPIALRVEPCADCRANT